MKDLDIKVRPIPHYGVKEAVFPFYFYPEVDPVLGPEMKSTGEVLGMGRILRDGILQGAGCCPELSAVTEGTVLITVADKDKPAVIDVARRFSDLGFKIMATSGTGKFLAENGIKSETGK